MALFEGKTPAERNKTIAAVALGVIALFFVLRMFLGSSSTSTTNTNTNRRARASNTNTTGAGRAATSGNQSDPANAAPDPSLVVPQPVDYRPLAAPDAPSAGRNIFAFYVAPTPAPKPPATLPPATPEPTPPLLITGVTPSNVYAKTGEFALQVNGDKFTPQSRIYLDGQELPTRYTGAQQVATTVPASFIAAPGGHQIMVRTPDGLLFSNSVTLNVTPPPAPTYTFVGVLIRPRGNDTAMLKDPKGELISVQRGDLVGGRFRVSSISARSVELTDQQLKINHTISYSDPRAGQNPPSSRGNSPQPQPQPARADDEEEVEP